jgi:hypothetical protein
MTRNQNLLNHGYPRDVFIAHAHLDNRDGWVDRLRESVTGELEILKGSRAAYWQTRPVGLSGLDNQHVQMISDALRETAVLIIVASPRFVVRPWFEIEYRTFLEHNTKDRRRLSRIMLVETSPDIKSQIPETLLHVQSFPFYDQPTFGSGRRLDTRDERYR